MNVRAFVQRSSYATASTLRLHSGKRKVGARLEKLYGGIEIFRTRPNRLWGPPCLLYNGHRISFPGLKRPRGDADHPPLLAPGRVWVQLIPLRPLTVCLVCNGQPSGLLLICYYYYYFFENFGSLKFCNVW